MLYWKKIQYATILDNSRYSYHSSNYYTWIFGYKSFKDIETKCVDISKTTTTKIVRRSLGSIVKSQMNDDNFSSDIIKAVRSEIENSTLKNIENRLSVLENSDGADTLPVEDSDTEQVPEIPSLPDNPEEASI